MMQKGLLLVLSLLWLLQACTPSLAPEGGGLRYARLLRLDEQAHHTVATLINPWDSTQVLASYALLPRERPQTDSLRLAAQGHQVLRTPLQRCVSSSAVHAALALDLHAEHQLAGICDPEWVVSQRIKKAAFPSFGSSLQPNVERLLQSRCDALFISPYEGNRGEALAELGVPIVLCADYLETSPLGRAEWMRFYGRLWGKTALADSLFQAEAEAYEALRKKAEQAPQPRPTLLIDKHEGNAWYVPAGESYMAQLYADAGARYLFAHLPGTGGTALDPERVLATAQAADLWVIKYAAHSPLNLQQLAHDHSLYAHFRAFQQKKVYGCNTLQLPYYEELPFRPSRLLRQWLSLIQPQRFPPTPQPYFTPLH